MSARDPPTAVAPIAQTACSAGSGTCRVCNEPGLAAFLDLGPQPIGNRFRRRKDELDERFPMSFGQCARCGLVQALDPPPAAALRPRFDWIRYSEHEDHLDNVADTIVRAVADPVSCMAVGVTFKDDTLLRRLRERGFRSTWRVDPHADLSVGPGPAGLETVQDRLTPEAARRLARTRGRADLVVARHILEHTIRPREFVAALRELASPQGLILLEVPDCSRAMEAWDYTTLWEEHTLYFTPKSFSDAVPRLGLERVVERGYPFVSEDALVILGRPAAEQARFDGPPPRELELGQRFAGGFPAVREAWRGWLARVRKREGSIALLGANHFAVVFANMMGVADRLDYVVDDDPNKQGMLLPGTNLRITGSEVLLANDVRSCLLAVNVGSESAVRSRYKEFLSRGGRFVALFPTSPLGLAVHPDQGVRGARRVADGVYYADGPIVKADQTTVQDLVRQARSSPRQRARLCAHPDPGAQLHDMIIAMTRGAYDRPHRHRTRAESLHVVEGEADFVVFAEDGTVQEVIPLGTPASGRCSFLRLIDSRWHMVVVRSESFAFHEATTGPFSPADSRFPAWAPDPSDERACHAFMEGLIQRIEGRSVVRP